MWRALDWRTDGLKFGDNVDTGLTEIIYICSRLASQEFPSRFGHGL